LSLEWGLKKLNTLSDILEIKVSVETANESSERYKHLGKWGMYIHKEFLLDIFRSKTTKVDFVEATHQLTSEENC
jgi:hypothetical protein